MKEKLPKGWIPDDIFPTILEYTPRSTVDLIVTRKRSGHKKEFLLGKRKERPFKGKWFIPGGSIIKGEKMEEALYRQLLRELGISSKSVKAITFLSYQDFFGVNEKNIRYHAIMHLFEIQIIPTTSIMPNSENTTINWFDGIDKQWPKALQEGLTTAGF